MNLKKKKISIPSQNTLNVRSVPPKNIVALNLT